ncbi:MAG TPA: efflux RND transporter periplasmic adaptor subunit [Burkholderiaceae bacterium]|nr:efflux RND transporter periplasmic adaptor subunit [Burkholderiaceae bacterium]
MKRLSALASPRTLAIGAGIAALVAVVIWNFGATANDDGATAPKAAQGAPPAAKPALSVVLTTPQPADWPRTLVANGNVVAWQEAIIGAEISGYRLTEVLVNVGDVVKKGQLLARISSDTVAAELTQSRAAVTEAEAMAGEARANAERARQLRPTGMMSGQQINQYLTAEQTALARVNAAKAKVQADELRLSQTRILAQDDGVISARTATVGSLAQPGQELFRLIRGGRLEWRAEVTAAELGKIKPGMTAFVFGTDNARVTGKVRMVGPVVDPQTRNAVVYVDLPVSKTGTPLRAGMFARGDFELGNGNALTLPQSAVLLRDGFAYVFKAEAQDGSATQARVTQNKVNVGRRVGDRIEITGGVDADTRVVASGAGFLADGDVVRVVDDPAPVKAAAK